MNDLQILKYTSLTFFRLFSFKNDIYANKKYNYFVSVNISNLKIQRENIENKNNRKNKKIENAMIDILLFNNH